MVLCWQMKAQELTHALTELTRNAWPVQIESWIEVSTEMGVKFGAESWKHFLWSDIQLLIWTSLWIFLFDLIEKIACNQDIHPPGIK